jgi:diguanylate cyclase (GGDEF)-like protein/PAS domain S-box-containing protein
MKKDHLDKYVNNLFRDWSYKAYRWGAVLFILLGILDFVSSPENFKTFLFYRITIAAILVSISYLSKRSTGQRVQKVLAYIAIAASAVTIEIMVLQFGGHASPYYVCMILLGICVLGFIPSRISFHLICAVLMYSIYFFPILLLEQINDFKSFFIANFFIVTIFGSALVLQFLRMRSLLNELALKYELESTVASLMESEEKYRSLVESYNDSIYVIDKEYRYIFINERHLSRLGISGKQYTGKTFGDLHTPEDTARFTAIVKEVFSTGRPIQSEYRSGKNGKYFLQTLSPVLGPEGDTRAVTVVSKNITRIKHLEHELRSLSNTDELTGIYNRRGFLTRIEQQLKIADRNKRGIFVLYADLDNLKIINDTYGHREGDRALIEAANILKKNYRKSDIIARIGGDEFVVVPVGTSKDSVEIITQRFYEALEVYNAQSNGHYRLSLSAGVAFYDPASPSTVDEMLSQADKLLYEEKRKNKSHACGSN